MTNVLIYGSLLLTSFIIDIGYCTKLIQAMTIPVYEPAIETNQQLADSNIIWTANHISWIFAIQYSTDVR